MDLRQITALVTVAEVGSVTQAARLLHLVQPAVTRQIRLLEEELGVALFERTPQGMRPTPEGEVLVERGRRALRELERARAELRPDVGEFTGVVTVGMLESVVELMASPLVAAVKQKHPAIQLRLVTAYSGHLQQWLDDGDIDVSLVYDLADTPSVAVLPLLTELLWVVAPGDAGLQAKKPVAWDDALAHPMILPVAGHGLRALIDRARSEASTSPVVVAEVNAMSAQKSLVAAGHGWTVLPAAGVAGDIAAGLLSGAPLATPEVARSLAIGHPRAARTPPAVRAVTAEMIRLARELVRSGRWPSARLSAAE